MRVQHNIASMNSYRNFNVNNSKMSKNLEKLSSGYAINRAGDDAAGLAVSEKMRWQITGLEAATKNAKDGIGLIQTAEGALTEVHDMLNRMTYLAEQSANGTYTATDRTNLNLEYAQLNAEIVRINGSANFNGNNLFNNASNVKITVDENGIQMTVSTSWSLTSLTALTDDISSATTAKNAVTKLKADINTVSQKRATLGAQQNRLEHTVNNLTTSSENLTAAESRIRDTDMAKEMLNFSKLQIMLQAGTSMLAQANQLPQNVLALIR